MSSRESRSSCKSRQWGAALSEGVQSRSWGLVPAVWISSPELLSLFGFNLFVSPRPGPSPLQAAPPWKEAELGVTRALHSKPPGDISLCFHDDLYRDSSQPVALPHSKSQAGTLHLGLGLQGSHGLGKRWRQIFSLLGQATKRPTLCHSRGELFSQHGAPMSSTDTQLAGRLQLKDQAEGALYGTPSGPACVTATSTHVPCLALARILFHSIWTGPSVPFASM